MVKGSFSKHFTKTREAKTQDHSRGFWNLDEWLRRVVAEWAPKLCFLLWAARDSSFWGGGQSLTMSLLTLPNKIQCFEVF